MKFLPFANVVVEEFGTNDIGQNGATANVTTIYNRLESIWTTARAAGVQKIVRTRLLPRTGSISGDWISLADQTPNPGWGQGEARDQLNAKFAAALTAGKIDTLVDGLAAVSDPVDDHCWLTNGNADYMTSDGAHPKPSSHQLLTPSLRAALLAQTVDVIPVSYSTWSAKITWAGADSDPAADPNGDGLNNLLAYALDISPLGVASAADLPRAALDNYIPNGPWLAFTYRQNSAAPDLVYQVELGADFSSWNPLGVDGINVASEVASPDPDGDGGSVLRRVRLKIPGNAPRQFLRLKVVK